MSRKNLGKVVIRKFPLISEKIIAENIWKPKVQLPSTQKKNR